MEFKHALERWHKIGEFAEYLSRLAEYNELQEIRKCAWYEWDHQSSEEYCENPNIKREGGFPTIEKPTGFHSKRECWKCPHREIIEGIPAVKQLEG